MTQKHNAAMNQAIDLLINNDTDVSTLFKEDGLLKQLTKRLVEKALQSEICNDSFLCRGVTVFFAGYGGSVIAKVKGTTKLHEKGTKEFGVT